MAYVWRIYCLYASCACRMPSDCDGGYCCIEIKAAAPALRPCYGVDVSRYSDGYYCYCILGYAFELPWWVDEGVTS